jgi:hypothetical protein
VIASPKESPGPETDASAPTRPEDLADVVGEARRDIG